MYYVPAKYNSTVFYNYHTVRITRNILETVNATVNFFFYFLIGHKFRQTLRRLLSSECATSGAQSIH